MIVTHRPPSSCPVCSTSLITLRLGCPECGTEVSGHFSSCRYCRLDGADQEILEIFLRGRGNVRDVQAHLEVSYPTARARLQDVLDRLGLGEEQTPPAGGDARDATLPPAAPTPPGAATRATTARDAEAPAGDVRHGSPTESDRLVAAVLAELASGGLSVSTAESLIARLV